MAFNVRQSVSQHIFLQNPFLNYYNKCNLKYTQRLKSKTAQQKIIKKQKMLVKEVRKQQRKRAELRDLYTEKVKLKTSVPGKHVMDG